MAKLFQPGTHEVTAHECAVYQNEKGSLIVAIRYEGEAGDPPEAHEITGYHCVAKPDGTLSEKTIADLKDVFGWDGCDPFWLTEQDLSQYPAQIEVESYTRNDGSLGVSVKWLNKPGQGGGGMPQSGDRNAIMAKFGARFRALAGGQARPRQQAKPTTSAAPAAPPKAAPATPTGPTADMNAAWGAFCQAAGDSMDQQAMNAAWFKCLGELAGTNDPNRVTPQGWGAVVAGCETWLADQLPL
jgi:hypothetical protein